MRRLVVLAAAMAVVACGDQTGAPTIGASPPVDTQFPAVESFESAPARIATNTPVPKPPLMVCLEATPASPPHRNRRQST